MERVYNFLGISMEYPQQEIFQTSYFPYLYQLLEDLNLVSQRENLKKAIEGSPNFIEDLKTEYTKLFINSFPRVPAPPYESYYRSCRNMLNDTAAQEVSSFYRNCGYSINRFIELPDHISYELEFTGALLEDGKYEEAEDFLNTHLSKWFPLFREKVLNHATHPFYKIIIDLIDFFIKTEEVLWATK
jgi:TorA maturation chaperone TorD